MGVRYLARPVVSSDLDSIHQIELASFSDPWPRKAIAESVEASGSVAIALCLLDGTIAGYLVGQVAAGEGEIHSIAVAAAERGKGAGSLLLAAALDAFREGAAGTVWLEVRESNLAALQLYGRAGFLVAGRRKGYYRSPVEDALILRLDLV